MGHVLILFGRYIGMFFRYHFCGPAHEIQRNRRIGRGSPSGGPDYGREKSGHQQIALAQTLI